LAIFDGPKPDERLSPPSITISRLLHSRLVGPADQLAPTLSLVVFEKEDCLWMSLTSQAPAPRITAFSPNPGDRPDRQFVTGRQKTDQAAALPLQS